MELTCEVGTMTFELKSIDAPAASLEADDGAASSATAAAAAATAVSTRSATSIDYGLNPVQGVARRTLTIFNGGEVRRITGTAPTMCYLTYTSVYVRVWVGGGPQVACPWSVTALPSPMLQAEPPRGEIKPGMTATVDIVLRGSVVGAFSGHVVVS